MLFDRIRRYICITIESLFSKQYINFFIELKIVFISLKLIMEQIKQLEYTNVKIFIWILFLLEFFIVILENLSLIILKKIFIYLSKYEKNGIFMNLYKIQYPIIKYKYNIPFYIHNIV